MRRGSRPHAGRTVLSGCLLGAIALGSLLGNADLRSPPRYDGAGYVVLARALLAGQSYRAIDHPDRPLHDHFPPGYPIALATLWTATGVSLPAAHIFSVACTLGAVLLVWLWLRRLYRPGVALGLALALAVNWTWGRVGASIQSEPPFLFLTGLGLLLAHDLRRRGGTWTALALGVVLGLGTLVRHVGICLIIAAFIDLGMMKRRGVALIVLFASLPVIAPWAYWVATVAERPQWVGIAQAGLVDRSAENALFYLRRIPDALIGPLIEVGTVFQTEWARALTWLAALTSGLILGGWTRGGTRRRLVGLSGSITLALLLVWPFTEAGRFLVPLVPVLLVGATEGLAGLMSWAGRKRPRPLAMLLVLLVSLPYPIYALVARRADATRRTHAEFDAACAWLANVADRPGPVLSRHPGEVFHQTGRTGLTPPEDGPEQIDLVIARYEVVYLLVDEDRYAKSPKGPLAKYAAERELEVVWQSEIGATRVYQVARRSDSP